MFTDQSGPGAVLVVLALAIGPALLRWWWGRSLARLAGDPLIAERLQAHHSRVGLLALVCLIALGVFWPVWAILTVPLFLLAQSIASYPLTRTLYRETWSLAASVSFYTRLPLAIFGFWVLLAATPWIVSIADGWDWIAAGVLAAILVSWDRYYADLVRAMLRSEPIGDRSLLDRFATLVSRSGIPPPRFECVNMKGGVLANALALPSLRQSSVLFTDTLISRLEPDQTAAICAHEIAHLEYYDRRRLRRLQIGNWVLIAIVCAMTPVGRMLLTPEDRRLPAIACTVAVVLALALRGRHRQRNETASDVRATELTGDPQALASALTAIHAIARVPRRWDQQQEQQATHPSLARRIRDIHAAAGTAPAATIENTVTFAAARGDAVVTFDKAHLHWQDAPGTTHVLDYSTLSELRLRVAPAGDATLVAVERQGRRWSMPSRPEDAAALQAMLDSVDGRLANPAASLTVTSPFARVVAVFGCTLAAMLGQFAFALVAILTALAPSAAMLNAAGGAAFVAAAVILAHSGEELALRVAFAFILGVLGAGFLLMARSRRSEITQPPAFAIVLIATGAVAAMTGIVLGGFDPIRLHQGARDVPAAPILLVALAAATWSWRNRPQVRHVPLVAALTGAAIVGIGSTLFLEHVGRDPFLVHAAPLRWAIVDGEPDASFDLAFEIESLRLSPSGHLAAFVRAEHDESSMRVAAPAFHVRRADGTFAVVPGADLAFVDDRSALVLTLDEGGAGITVASFDGAPALDWRERIPGIRAASLSYHRARSQWTLVGRDDAGNILRVTGTVGRSEVQRTTWKGPEDLGGWINAIGTRGEAAIALQKNYDNGLLGRALAMQLPVALIPTFPESRVWRLGPGARSESGRSLLDVNCGFDSRDDDAMVCTAFDGTLTRIVTIEPSTGQVSGVGSIEGAFYANPSSERGWLSGWWQSAQTTIHLETRLAFRLPYHPDEYVTVVAPAESVIGAAAPIEGGMRVRIYPLSVVMSAVTRAE